MHRPPLGGETAPAALAAGIGHFFVKRLWHDIIQNAESWKFGTAQRKFAENCRIITDMSDADRAQHQFAGQASEATRAKD